MAHVTFWGKPGCVGNARQMAVLRASGHVLDVRNLLAEAWTPERLRPFFGPTPVTAWFNQSSPRIKQGEVRPEAMTETDALAAMIADPLLIRRPLLACDDITIAGFDRNLVATWIGLTGGLTSVSEGCPRPDMASCQPPPETEQEHISD
ncbi:MAG: ArsC/Spx/MgsR family protein [Rhodopila sp.]